MRNTRNSGFTIVELLIVIVIIGILAAIVIVAYNGITQQARTAKTLSAIDAWAKALRLHKAEKGNFPAINSCLGSTTTYPDGYCWDGTSWDVTPSFLTALEPYIGSSYPEPDLTPIHNTLTQRRGAFFIIRAGTPVQHNIRAMFAGESSCPASSVGPLAPLQDPNTGTNPLGVWCEYNLD